MNYLRTILLTIGILCLTLILKAQRTEVGVFVGGSYYVGDLNPNQHFLQVFPSFGLTYRYALNTRWVFKGNLFFGEVAGDDKISGFNVRRNLSFNSSLAEAAAGFEFNFFPYVAGNPKFRYTPYIFTQLGFFKFNPTADFNGRTYELQPLGTEGQGTSLGLQPYSLVAFCFPFGVGFKASLFGNTSLALEYGLRMTGTDYLDDVSTVYADPKILATQNTPASALLADRSVDKHLPGEQRGNSKNNDWYSFFGLSFGLKINAKGKEYCPAYKTPTKRAKLRVFEKE